jgi:hypothetical protein
MNLDPGSKPRLQDGVQFIPAPGGAFVVVPGRGDLGFPVTGRAAHQWYQRIAPFLTGEHTLEALGAGLDPARRGHLMALVETLAREGVVRDAAGDHPHGLSPEVRRVHASVIAFIARAADSPEHRFQRYRESDPLVVGAGQLVAPLVHALLATGVERVRTVLTGERPTDLGRLREILASTLGPAALARWQVSAEDPSTAATAGVLHVCETPAPGRAAALSAACAGRGIFFGQAVVAGDRGLVGPVGDRPPRWIPEGDRPAGDLLSGPTAALVANHLAAAFLAATAQLPTADPDRIATIDLETLRAATLALDERAAR